MKQEDFTNAAGRKVDRLTAVKEALEDFLSHREGDRVGLVVFGDAPFLQAPFSTDLGLSRQLLDETVVGMAGPRTAFGDAIGLGISLFEKSDAPARAIIALTDGNDTASQVPPVEAARV
ncbi:MAG TPA: VWA domain-containing protein, partial [Terrimicrobiaceae bacterium]